jgi:glucose uptake protein
VIWNYFVNPQGNPVLLFTGVALVVAAIVLDGVAYRIHTIAKEAGNREPK